MVTVTSESRRPVGTETNMENENKGTVKAICISLKKGTSKTTVDRAVFMEDHGIEGDAHAGKWHRQISLLASESVDRFKNDRLRAGGEIEPIEPGAFGENILTKGIELKELRCGSFLKVGDEVVLKISQRGKECHSGCEIRKRTGDCIMPREGVFATVIKGGTVTAGDAISVEPPARDRSFTAAVITLSDRAYDHVREDLSGPALARLLKEAGYEVIEELLLPDGKEELKTNLIRLADRRDADLILTTGGTGFSERDVTPEATLEVATRNAPGIAEAIRTASGKITPRAMLSRGASVIRGKTLIINLPGSPKAVEECFAVIRDAVPHGLAVLTGREGD